ncbi:hypothetical protein P3D53_27950, partial [Pseudomonas aeruginosa]
MNDFSPAEFLRREVFPRLDAVQANLLDGFDPKQRTGSGSYPLTCPACKAKEAFYFPFSGFINCPRKKECGKSTSIWDAMLLSGYDHGEIFSTLCEAARVEPPKRDQSGAQAKREGAAEIRIGKAIWQITQKMASENAAALKAFQEARRYTPEHMAAMRLGYYTTPQEILTRLTALGFTKEDALACGYVEADESGALLTGLSGRVVGYWPHPDGEDRLWGR